MRGFFTLLSCLLATLSLACGDNLTHPDPLEPWTSSGQQPLECVPNLDGVITADEIRPAIAVPVSFAVSPDGEQREVDQLGATDDAGRLVWDWSQREVDDQGLTVEAESISGRWYQDGFPADAFVLPFDPGGTIEAVYTHDDAAIWLHGLASSERTPTTLLAYDEPIAVNRFPIATGDSYESVGVIRDGLLQGLPYAGRDVYRVEVVDAGRLLLPDLSFTQAHLVQTEVRLEPAVGSPTSQRQSSWLFECFGEVARATSRRDEVRADFRVAAEVRRLGLW